MQNTKHLDIQGHRGARGHFPENTIAAFIEAVKMGVDTLELDVIISDDNKVVVSHEPWMNDLFCTKPDGTAVEKGSEQKYNLHKMTYAEIKSFDCGKRINPNFPSQKAMPSYKPLLSEVIEKVEAFTNTNKLPPVKYNIEIKSEEKDDAIFNPLPEVFVNLVYEELKKFNLWSRIILQSFDVRILQELRKKDSSLTISFLVENNDSLEINLTKLGFTPAIYTPEFILIDEQLVEKLHKQSIKIFTWTVNESEDIKKMIALGVDGIISDYPDRIINLVRKQNSFSAKNRNEITGLLKNTSFDLLVIGGGITGAGIALDATARGLKVALIEMQDFASGTSGRSTKLIHGGLRYLKQLEFKLVAEVGKEREILHKNAPHLAKPEPMLLPIVKNGSLGKFSARMGMWIYEWLAGVKKAELHKTLSKEKTLQAEPLLRKDNLLNSFLFYEYRTDDARLTLEVLKEAVSRGAIAINYLKAVSFIYEGNKIAGVKAQNMLSEEIFEIRATHLVNAGGPWVDELDDLEKNHDKHKLHITKGIHLVVDHKKLPVKQSVYFDTHDKRMIFAIPREGKTYIGTTDTFYEGDIVNPKITSGDRDYILKCINDCFPDAKITAADIESGWAGLRPLINKPGKGPSEISRKDEIFTSASGLLTIAGGKLTGYRKMAQRITDIVAKRIFDARGKIISECSTQHIALSGGKSNVVTALSSRFTSQETEKLLQRYGSNIAKVFEIAENLQEESEIPIILRAQLIYAVQNEMCQTPSDFFIRRTSALYFDIETVKKWKDTATEYMQKLLGWNGELTSRFIKELQEAVEEVSNLK